VSDSPSPALQAHLLDSLYEAASLLERGRSEPDLCRNLLLGALGSLGMTRGAVLLRRPAGLEVMAATAGSLAAGPLQAGAGLDAELEELLAGATAPPGGGLRAAGLDCAVPLRVGERSLGLICLGRPAAGGELGAHEERFLRALAAFHAVSIRDVQDCQRLSETNDDLARRNSELQSLFELSKRCSGTIEEREILDLLAFSLMGALTLTRVSVLLAAEDQWTVAVEKGRALPPELLDALPRPGPEAARSGPWRKVARDAGLGACVPVSATSGLAACVAVGEPLSGRGLEAEDRRLIATLAAVTLGAIESARLFQDALERQRLERELAIARTIQEGLCPQTLPELPGIEIAALTRPSREIGGDLFEALRLEDGSVLLAVADVTGKGVPAALLAASIQAAIRTLSRIGLGLAELARRVNQLVCEQTDAGHFATCFLARYHPATGRLACCCAGHDPAFLLEGRGGLRTLSTGGLLLGVVPEAGYQVEELSFDPGSVLAIYTDGLTEAQASVSGNGEDGVGAEGEELGPERLAAIVRDALDCSALDRAAARILAAIDTFTAGAPPSDDRTLLLLRR